MQQVLRTEKFRLLTTFGKITWRERATSLSHRRGDNIKNGPFNRVIWAVGLSGSC